MRQPHPELNFRKGKGWFKPTVKDFVEACRLVGLTDDEIRAKLQEILDNRGDKNE